MDIGAVLITAGCGKEAGMPSGSISVAQRMIAVLQKAGVAMIAVVTDPEDKKLEKQLAQSGVFFLRNESPDDIARSARLGLAYLEKKCDRIFFVQADRPLLDPDTLEMMLNTAGAIVVPAHRGQSGQPMLLRLPYNGHDPFRFEMPDTARILEVEDPSIHLHAAQAAVLTDAIARHDRKLTRPVLDFAITRGKPVLDGKLITLLNLIRETQSVRDACSRMQISYSTAWNLLNSAEDSLGYPLILRNKGGPSGSGSLLTERGSTLLSACEQFELAAREKISQLYDAYFRDII